MRPWRDRIGAARQPTRWFFVRGFTKLDRIHAGDWKTCAVGEQIRLGRVDTSILKDPRMYRLGMKFHEAVWVSRFVGRLAVRRAEAIFEEIENYALELDWRQAQSSPAPARVPPTAASPAFEPAASRAAAAAASTDDFPNK